ncbi:Predicted arabinose efflux permease, MFS family [Luteibacter sp. UNC138MFCol5.1]|uniref:MFS transporter n=1 Tax=Luteibacter sp. UNC138MFCol5.1 TaxID=1502774 RepID=UPI0008D77F60|nr:MFS transporter [Luteibacter sp. UNC138MFCol5.1]SEO58448.1 Predicted arabinose efflux permease, MFS family [Luteibacter sp. UNC138MFCol5.1]
MSTIPSIAGTLTRAQVASMAVATGTTVANLYYSQPILGDMAASLHVTGAQAGVVPILSQAGFAIGLVFVAPLGDLIDRKRLVIALEAMLCVALLALGVAPTLLAVYVAAFLTGVCATAVQVIVPLAATLAPPERRGHVVSQVFTGTLTGILSARIVAGLVAASWGWRAIFELSASAAAGVACLTAAMVPSEGVRHGQPYLRLLASTAAQWGRFATLRRVSLLGALTFGVFCAYWTTLTFELRAAFGFHTRQIGLFGIAAVLGAAVSPLAGKLSDRLKPSRMQLVTLGVLLVGTLLAAAGASSVWVLALATVVIDVGVQATQVSSLAQVYALDPLANSRINTVYIATFFTGGALGTTLGIQAWRLDGWTAVCVLLCLLSAIALVVAWRNAGDRSAAD